MTVKKGSVEFVVSKARRYALVDVKGEPGKLFGPSLGRVMGWAMQKGYAEQGPPIGIYHDSPEDVPMDQMRMTIGVVVNDRARGEGDVRVETFPPREEAVLVHKGPYVSIGEAYGALMGAVFSSGRSPTGPPMEVYVSDPNRVAPAELLTEIRIPVRKA